MNFFSETVKMNQECRYEVCLPWSIGHPELLNNREIAEKRLISISKKLVDNKRMSEYERIFQEWEKSGIIEEVSEVEFNYKAHYLPHHAVIEENSATTKIRPVFDASSKDRKGHSLNDCVEKGPNLIECIPSVMLQFRLGSIGVVSDIKKAFLQISLSPKDRDFLRFLRWKDYQKKESFQTSKGSVWSFL